MTLADEVTAMLAEARVEIAEAFHADEYELLRVARVEAGDGQWVQQADAVVESGRCALLERGGGGAREDEQVIAELGELTVELPIATIAGPADAIRINGRRHLIEDVQREGRHRLFAVARLRARE